MRNRELFLTGCWIALILLASCQNAIALPSRDPKDEGQIASLIDGKTGSRSGSLDELNRVLQSEETSTGTPFAADPASTIGPGSCTVHTEQYRTAYAGPGTGYSLVGRLEPGHDYLVTGMYYRDDFPTWWRIDLWGAEGWINGYGASTDFVLGASCTPSVELVAIDPLPTAPGACTYHSPEASTIYSGPGTGYSIVDQLEPGREYLVTGMYYAGNYPTWWRIDYDGAQGWIDAGNGYSNFMPEASCNPPVDFINSNPPQVVTPSPTPELQPGACYVAPVDETANLQVYAGPAFSHPIIGMTQPRQYYLATGILPSYLLGQGPGVQIDFNGMPGWVDASAYMFQGDCWPIPTLDTWPTPIVTSTPSPFPTISPTSTLEPGISPNQVTDISSTVGTTTQITGTLPTSGGQTTTVAAIRVHFGPEEVGPYDGVRMLNILVQCTGVNPQNLRWGYYGSETDIECGRYIDTGVSQGGNLVALALAIPSDGMTAVTYTITVTVNGP